MLDALPAGDVPPDGYAQALEGLHGEMRRIAVEAPHFTDRVDEAHAIVRNPSRSPNLADADRELLTNTLRSLRRTVIDRSATEQLLHGEPHAGNVLKTADGMRFIDLGTYCYGPSVSTSPTHPSRSVVATRPPTGSSFATAEYSCSR